MQAVVIAAGEGIRLRPLTDSMPKCMVEIKGKPLLQRVLENLANAGISEFHLVVGYKKEAVEDYFGEEFEGIKLNYFVQPSPRGTAHAVSLVYGHTQGDFLVANGDVIASTKDYRKLVKIDSEAKFDALVLARNVSEPWRFGVLKTNGSAIVEVVEKPNPGKEPSNLINAGVYRFKDDFFEAIIDTELSPRGEYEIVDSITKYIDMGKRVDYVLAEDACVDISGIEDYNAANKIDDFLFPK